LQQAINAAQASVSGGRFKEAHIPTPPTIASNVQYDVLYPARFEQPATYIRSSSTVEDHCNGSLYCMDEADEIALQRINAQLPSELKPCTEDQFEEVMSFFEETVHTKQPYATLDNAPVLPLEDFQDQFEETTGSTVRRLAKHVYEHWRSRRLETANHSLQPSLKVSQLTTLPELPLTITKFETGQDTDDADPYVCFRRREIRQIRKTRHRDAQSAEKLRRLRKELEDARHIVAMVKQREIMRKELLSVDKMLFKQRADVKETKRKLGIKGDDEDLINQKVSYPQLRMEARRLIVVTAQEEDHGEPRSRPPHSTDALSPHWPWRAWGRPATSRRLAGRESESNSERDPAERGQAHQVERRVRRQNKSTTYSNLPPELCIQLGLSTSHACHRVPTNPSCIGGC
jgi:enhancer of polycomb-like protein